MEDVDQLRAEVTHLGEQLRERDRAIAMLQDAAETFLSTVTHDLKNPVAAIKLTVQGLRRSVERGETNQRLDERLGQMEDSIQQLLDRLTEARARVSADLAPAEAAKLEPCDLVRILHEVTALFQQAARRHSIKLECTHPVLVGNWDERLLRRTVHQLLDNAIKFSPAGGEVRLGLQRQPGQPHDWAVLQVTDRGMGIPARDVPRVFDRFYRGENAIGAVKGAGLGLFLARRDVEQHGGSVAVHSREGDGACFTVRLPFA